MPCCIRMSPVMYIIFIYAVYMLLVFPITELLCYLIGKYTSSDPQQHHPLARAIYLFFLLTFLPLYFLAFYLSWRKNRAKALFTPKWKISDNLEEDDFTCTICYDLMVEPHTLRCQHSFCKKCINQSLRLNRKCPACQQWVYTCRSNSEMKRTLMNWIKEQGREEEYAEVVQAKSAMKIKRGGVFANLCVFFQPFFQIPDQPPIRLRPINRAAVEPVSHSAPTALVVDIIDEFEPVPPGAAEENALDLFPDQELPSLPLTEPAQCSPVN